MDFDIENFVAMVISNSRQCKHAGIDNRHNAYQIIPFIRHKKQSDKYDASADAPIEQEQHKCNSESTKQYLTTNDKRNENFMTP